MLIDNVYRHSWGVDAPGVQWAEARDAEKCLAMHRSLPKQRLIWSPKLVVPLLLVPPHLKN